MKKIIEKFFCDICGAECKDVKRINYPVVFHTDQTEGRSCEPYISNQNMDVCNDCCLKILKVSGMGAQGCNTYSISNITKVNERRCGVMNYFSLKDFLLYERLAKKEGSAMFIPKRSNQLKNKRRKRGKSGRKRY